MDRRHAPVRPMKHAALARRSSKRSSRDPAMARIPREAAPHLPIQPTIVRLGLSNAREPEPAAAARAEQVPEPVRPSHPLTTPASNARGYGSLRVNRGVTATPIEGANPTFDTKVNRTFNSNKT